MAALNLEEKSKYAKDGYIIPQYRLPPDRMVALRSTLDDLIAANPDVRPEKLVSAHLEGKNAEGVTGSAEFLALARDPDIVDHVADLIGEDVILWGCQVFCKPGGIGFETPWHQDGHYWPIRPLATCTVWVALDPSTRENGCLKVIPGSHESQNLFPHMHEDRQDVVLADRTSDDAFDASKAIDLELEPGQFSMHDVFLIHGADANRSPIRRAGVALRYMPATSVFNRELKPLNGMSGIPVNFATRPLWLLRGRDQTNQNDFKIGHN